MPQAVQVKAYKYSELTDEALEKARNWCYEHLMDHDWWECVYDDWIEKLAELGIETEAKQMFYSGYGPPGDGACFTGRIDVPKFMLAHELVKDNLIIYVEAVEGSITAKLVRTRSNYSHYGTTTLDIYDNDGNEDITNEDMRAFEEAVKELCHDYMKTFYRDLEKEYEALTTDESFADVCGANEYLFDAHGRFI